MNNNSGDVEYKGNEGEPNRLAVAKEQARDVGAFNPCFVRNNQQLSVFPKDELQILVTERYYSPVVDDQVRKQCVCLFVAVVYRFLVELKLADAESAQDHERRRDRDHDCQLPAEDKAY